MKNSPAVDYEIRTVRKILDRAKREPGHSPTEDALLNIIETLVDCVEMLSKQEVT
jgi:hypothetical protein